MYWQQALALYQKIDEREGALHVTQSMGLLELSRGHYTEAGERLDASLRQAEDLQLAEEVAVAHVYRGELALAQGRLSDARAAALQAGSGFARRADQRGTAEAALLNARVEIALGDAAAARNALAGIDAAPLSGEQQALHELTLARAWSLQGDSTKASTSLAAAERLADSAHAAAIQQDIRAERVRRALADGDIKRADSLLVEWQRRVDRSGLAPQRLTLIELQLARSLRAPRSATALAAYRQAQPLLQQVGRWRDAGLLHQLGARVLERAGEHSEARAAAAAATDARAQLLAAAPEASRATLERELQRRWREASGDVDEH